MAVPAGTPPLKSHLSFGSSWSPPRWGVGVPHGRSGGRKCGRCAPKCPCSVTRAGKCPPRAAPTDMADVSGAAAQPADALLTPWGSPLGPQALPRAGLCKGAPSASLAPWSRVSDLEVASPE